MAYIKFMCNDNMGVSPLLHSDSGKKAEVLNWQFKFVFTVDDRTTSIPEMSGPSYLSISNIRITGLGIAKLLSKFPEHEYQVWIAPQTCF